MIIMKRGSVARSSMTFPAILLGLAVLSSGIYMYKDTHTRKYNPGYTDSDQDNDAGVAGMYKYFFNARKNPATNSLDYAAMIKAQEEVLNMRRNHGPTGAMGLNWRSMGPSSVGGRTRAILIDNGDPTGQTIIAGGVSGGLWRSVNGGASWDSVDDNMGNLSIGCITQDSQGWIYAGTGEGFSVYVTGEGFSTGILGGGVYRSKDHGLTFTQLAATKPSATNSITASWAYTNRIAVLPNNPAIIYAATNQGVEMSTDTGKTFVFATNATSGKNLTGTALDLKVSNDGQLIIACVGGSAFYCYPNTANNKFYAIHTVNRGLPSAGGGGRIEFGIAPDNHDIVFASVVTGSNSFAGIYFTMTAVSAANGGNWYEIGPGGSKSFDPYGLPGLSSSSDQGLYDNTVAVFPGTPSKALFGGTTLWSWTQAQTGDSAGGWASVTQYPPYLGIPSVVHSDLHTIVIDPNNSKVVFIGCDGGIYKSYDGANTWQPENRDYDVTQFYDIAFSPYVNDTNGEGIMGGTQDNGTPYMNGLQYYPQDGIYVGQGDGGGCFISGINPNAYYVTFDNNGMSRSAALNSVTAFTGPVPGGNAYTTLIGIGKGANIDSMANLGSGCFVTPLAVYENPYDTKTLDSMLYIANANHKAGDTVYPVSPNGQLPFPYVLSKAISAGDTIKVQNRVVSKMAVAFAASNGVWINMQAADFADPVIWMPIGGIQSKPDAFVGNDPVHSLAFSADGDALFAGTEGGQFYRFSNLDSIIDTSYITGAIYSLGHNSKTEVVNSLTRVKSTKLTLPVTNGDILSIDVDPKNGNNVMVTMGGYGLATNVYFSSNALSASPTFKSAQGNLPGMPVYSGILDPVNSTFSKGAVLATEHGVWSTTDITVASPVWSQDNNGMANTLVLAMKQETLPPWECNNSGDIYIGTHGRGAWVDTSFFVPTGIKPIAAVSLKVNMNIYPNPMNVGGTIAFTLPKEGKATITVYDMQGRVVKDIPVTSQAPGEHTVSFSSLDMAPGVYVATLVGDSFRQTSKFVVTR